MHNLTKFFFVVGLFFVLIGCAFLLFPDLSFFKLPGDIILKKDNLVLIFPVGAGIILSIVLTVILNILLRK